VFVFREAVPYINPQDFYGCKAMNTRLPIFAAMTALLANGCASVPSYTRTTNSLDRGIRYVENPVNGNDIDMSSTPGQGLVVPKGAEVDINSTIEISIQKDAVNMPTGAVEDEAAAKALQAKIQKLQTMVEALANVIEARTKALEAYKKTDGIPLESLIKTPEYKDFLTARDASDKLESVFLETSRSLWRAGIFPFSEEEFEVKFLDSTYADVGKMIQAELDSTETAWKTTQDRLKQKALSLRMEAFLEKREGDPVAIHLENYDSLDQREAKYKESFVLDKDDWATLQKQYAETVSLAKQAERVRKGEVSLGDSIKNSGIASLQRLAALGEEVAPLLKEDWSATGTGIIRDISAAQVIVEDVVKKAASVEVGSIATQLRGLKQTALSVPPLIEARAVLGEITALQTDWKTVTPENLPRLIDRTQGVVNKARLVLSKLDKSQFNAFQIALSSTVSVLESRPDEMPREVWLNLNSELERQGTLRRIKDTYAKTLALKSFTEGVKAELSLLAVKPTLLDFRVPEAREVLWADAPDTQIDIQRTPRAIGDRLHVISTLKMDDKDYMKSHAVFSVKQFGWHSQLAPSVILAKPFNPRTDFDQDFKFAPAVVLLRRFYPRNSDNTAWGKFSRCSQMGYGLHATFLDQNPQKELEVGLGVAVSFWEDRLVAGGGVNLMDNSRGYFYIGSNLIPILQALGYGQENSTGKKP